MNINIDYDVFIAFHDSSGEDKALAEAKEVYDYLEENGIKCFLFPSSSVSSLYKSNFIKIMQSRLLILVCNSNLSRTSTGEIDYKKNYHLYVELDSFFALTQSDGGYKSINDAKVIYFADNDEKKLNHSPETLHPLFGNRNSFIIANSDKEEALEELLDWVEERLDNYDSSDVSNEVITVLASRKPDVLNSKIEGIDFKKVFRKADKIKCVGISNWMFSLTDGCEKLKKGLAKGIDFEMLYLNPDGEFVKLRTVEEKKDTRGQILQSFDMMKSELKNTNPEQLSHLKAYLFDLIPRENLIFVYGEEDYLFVQQYSHALPGSTSPCTILKRNKNQASPIFEHYENIFNSILNDENTKEYNILEQ